MPLVNTPIALQAYPTPTDGVWTFPWGLVFDPSVHNPEDLVYELEVDTFPTFSSPNLQHVFSTSAGLAAFQDGPLGKAIELSLPKRSLIGPTTWYWRMRINGGGYGGGYLSNWTDPHTLIVPKDQTVDQATALWDDVADENTYSKTANSSDAYKIMQMIARELDQALLENTYTQSDLSLEQSRDTALKNNFGLLTGLSPVVTEPTVSYRWKVRELFKSFINSPGVITGIRRVVRAFVGEDPTILDSTNTQGWIIPINYIVDPNHPELQPTIILYSAIDKGFHWKLNVWNSWNLVYDQSVLEDYVNKIKPAHTETTFVYQTQKHAQVSFNTSSDWNSCTLTNLTVNTSGGLTLAGANLTGTAVSPVVHVKNMNAWDVLNLTQDLVGQTIQVQLRSSLTGTIGSFSSWETLYVGQTPSTTQLQDYLQFQITISTGVLANKPVLNTLLLKVLHS